MVDEPESDLRVPGTRKRITSALFATQGLFSAAAISGVTLMPSIAAQLSGTDSAVGVPPTLTLIG